MNSSEPCTSEQSKSSRRSPKLRKDFPRDQSSWYDDCLDESGKIGDLQWQSRERTRNNDGACNTVSTTCNRARDRHSCNSCSCGHQEDYGDTDNCFMSTVRCGREMKIARKTGVEKPRVHYRRCYPLDSFIVSKGSRVVSTQKNANPKQVWEPMDARKKTNLDNTAKASGSIGNVDPLKPVECDTSGFQKVGAECEPLPLDSESSRDVYKPEVDQPYENIEINQDTLCDVTLLVSKHKCYSTNDEGSSHDEEPMANSASSDSSSSCMSEGDRESTTSSTTSSCAQNPDSSSSNSEESPVRTNSILGTPSIRPASRSLLETCAGKGFREYGPKSTRPVRSDRSGFGMPPFQDQLMYHRSMNVPPHSPATMGLHNHSWAAPTNGNFQYGRPSHIYSSPLVFGVPGNQFADYLARQYSSVNPYLAPAFNRMPAEPIHRTAASFRAMSPSPPCQNGAQPIVGHTKDMNLEGHSSKLIPLSLKDLPEDEKSPDTDVSFSLFQFNLPIASSVPPSSKGDKTGESAARTPLTQVQAQLCAREQTDVKEYNLFSTKDSGISFSFM
uniref:Uncharacterized protein n=1 Tax=Arundo donax TaxID=35708 RepID=A0A0A9F9B1_ARUDO